MRSLGLMPVWVPLRSQTNGVNVHKAFLLRARLSHVVTSVYTYIMTRILHGLQVELREKLLTATDLDELFSIHMW